MAFVILGGRGGVKASWWSFSQPSGAVMMTSSKTKGLVEVAVVMVTEGLPLKRVVEVIEVTGVERWRVALSRAGLATRARMEA